jgi:hypothetical protein
LKTIYTDNDRFVSFNRSLISIGSFLYFALHITRFDRPQHSAHCVNLAEIVFRAVLNLVGQLLNRIRARKRICGIGNSRFVRDNLLRP